MQQWALVLWVAVLPAVPVRLPRGQYALPRGERYLVGEVCVLVLRSLGLQLLRGENRTRSFSLPVSFVFRRSHSCSYRVPYWCSYFCANLCTYFCAYKRTFRSSRTVCTS